MTGEGQEGVNSQQALSRRDFLKLIALSTGLAACSTALSSPDAGDLRGIVHESDMRFLLPPVARDAATFSPLTGLPEITDLARIEPVVVSFPAIVAQTLNLDTSGTSRLMGLVQIGDQPVLVPIMGYSPDALPQLRAITEQNQPREFAIAPARFFEGLFGSRNGLNIDSKALHNGFSFEQGGQRHMVGGPNSTGNYDLVFLEPRVATRADRVLLVQIRREGQIVAYKTVSAGILPGELRGPAYHYMLRHGADGLAPAGNIVQNFVTELPDSIKSGISDLLAGKTTRSGLTPLMLVESPGKTTYILAQARAGDLNLGPVFIFKGPNGFVHGYRPIMTESVVDGIVTTRPYDAAMAMVLDRLKSNGGAKLTVFAREGSMQIDAAKFVRKPTPEIYELLRAAQDDRFLIPGEKAGLRSWNGWKLAGKVGRVGGPILSAVSIAGIFPVGLTFGLDRYGNCEILAECADDGAKILMSRMAFEIPWVATSEISGEILLKWSEITKEAERAGKPKPLFITVNEDKVSAERSGDNPGGIAFTINTEEEAVDSLNVINLDEGAGSALFYPGDEAVTIEELTISQQLSVPTTVIDVLPSNKEFLESIARTIKDGEQPKFAYRKISTPFGFVNDQPKHYINYYIASFKTANGRTVTHIIKDTISLAKEPPGVIISTIMAKLMREKNGDTDGPSVEIDLGMLDDEKVKKLVVQRFSTKPAGTLVTFTGVFSPEVPEGEEARGVPEFRPEEHPMFEYWGVVIKRLMRAGVLIQPEEGVASFTLAPKHLKPQAESK